MFSAPARQWLACFLIVFIVILGGCESASTIPVVPVKSTTTSPTAPPLQSNPFPNATQIDTYLTHLAEAGVLSGSVLVAHNGMLFSKGYGLADKDSHVPNTPQTRFRIGSVSKQFAAMAILLLQEQGKLHVQDHLCLYIPNCPTAWQPITLFHLLTHSSGIPDYTNLADFVATWTIPTTPQELISRFINLPLDFSPGSRFRYSNSGFVLLGYIIEHVSGESYATFLQKHIFTPLKLSNTGYDTTYPTLPQHATGYYADYVKPAPYDMSVLYAAGALYSTTEDLYRWDLALQQHTLLSPQAEDSMFTLHMPCPSSGPGGCLMHSDQGYGYGLFIATQPEGRLIYHVGHIDGFFAYNGFYANKDLEVVVLSNLETTDVLKIGRVLAGMVYGNS